MQISPTQRRLQTSNLLLASGLCALDTCPKQSAERFNPFLFGCSLFHLENTFKVYSCSIYKNFHSFYDEVSHMREYHLVFVYSFICWWTLGFSPLFGYCRWCWEHLHFSHFKSLVLFFCSFEYISRSRIIGQHDNYVLNNQTIFHSDDIISQSHLQCV